MIKWLKSSLLLLLIVALVPVSGLTASSKSSKDKDLPQAHIYRYKDAEGNLHMGRQIPPENYKYGYTALDQYGKVIREVPPEPTPEERQQYQQEMAQKKRNEMIQQRDEQLQKTYSSVKDAISARDRKMAQIDVMLEIIRGKLAVLSANYDRVVQLAAALERDGRQVETELLSEMANLEKGIVELQQSEKDKIQEKAKVKVDYEPIIERLEVLYDK